MIRRAIVAPLASLLRRRGRALPAGTLWEITTEATIYLLGWLVWVLDWIPRLPKIALALTGRLRPGVIEVCPVVLLEGDRDPGAQLENAHGLCAQASALLEPHGVALSWPSPGERPGKPSSHARWSGGPPRCRARELFSPFFRWASARADTQALTVYLVGDFGALAGCSFPGADWMVLDSRTDGTTLVHELGHLAGLWAHSRDPHNVMTGKAGGSHDRLTRFQAAMIRTSHYARGVRVSSAPLPGGSELG